MAGEHISNNELVDAQLIIRILGDKVADLTIQNAVLVAQLKMAQNNQ